MKMIRSLSMEVSVWVALDEWANSKGISLSSAGESIIAEKMAIKITTRRKFSSETLKDRRDEWLTWLKTLNDDGTPRFASYEEYVERFPVPNAAR